MGGLYVGARRKAKVDSYYWRITPWSCLVHHRPAARRPPVRGHFWVPIDDVNCWAWTTYDYHPLRPLRDSEPQAMKDGKGGTVEIMPGTYRALTNKRNDYLIDRAAQSWQD